MVMKPITVEDYQEYSGEFFDKYFFIARELGEDARAEDILKVMEALSGVVMLKRKESKTTGPMGFNKTTEEVEENADVSS
jgi:hypothetical protein